MTGAGSSLVVDPADSVFRVVVAARYVLLSKPYTAEDIDRLVVYEDMGPGGMIMKICPAEQN